jgi:hypothetical protein
MRRQWRELEERLARIEKSVDAISRSMDKIEVATIVREPSSALSAEAYDGLRKQVVAGANERLAHLVQIAQFSEAARGTPELAKLVREWSEQVGLLRLVEFDERYFDVLGGKGEVIRCLRPAYIDKVTGRPIIMGQAELVPGDRQPSMARHQPDDDSNPNPGHQQEIVR